MILVSQLRYRRLATLGALPRSTFRTPGAPYTTVFALLFIGLVVVMMGIDEDARISLYCAPLWAALLGIAYRISRPGSRAAGPRGSEALGGPHGAGDRAFAED